MQVVWRQAPPVSMNNPMTRTITSSHSYWLTPIHVSIVFNLNQAPLFAADIAHDPAQDEWLLALRFHHLVSDHMTLELIFAEIAQIQAG
ncbi:hypothetical protein [Xenorhabdus thailandensis]|uniref:hypothetical protein n=1 Tax=Xenorhabdus thailandensis TaxID=3136255 RepID=UPI0030F4AE5B